MWYIYALACMLAWGAADLFHKKSANKDDKYSHIKTTMVVGCVMGIHAIITLAISNINYDIKNILIYMPVSLMYIISMMIGYYGLKYLALSISSPIQNSSGAITVILCLIILGQTMSKVSAAGVILITIGIIILGSCEKEISKEKSDEKYKNGVAAIIIPIIYCIIDGIGTFLDAWYLDDISTTPLKNVTEETLELVANTSYELTFLAVGIILMIYLFIVKKQKIKIREIKNSGTAAILETAGQFAYIYAIGANSIVAAPMVSAYCIVSLLLSRIILKEKLTQKHYLAIALVIIGIIIIAI